MNGTCQGCKWWKPETTREHAWRGDCKRHAPVLGLVVTTNPYEHTEGRFPRTENHDSCGDYEAAPEETP